MLHGACGRKKPYRVALLSWSLGYGYCRFRRTRKDNLHKWTKPFSFSGAVNEMVLTLFLKNVCVFIWTFLSPYPFYHQSQYRTPFYKYSCDSQSKSHVSEVLFQCRLKYSIIPLAFDVAPTSPGWKTKVHNQHWIYQRKFCPVFAARRISAFSVDFCI